jgi:hypothetical protein
MPLFRDKNAMRDFSDKNGLWATIVTALKSKVPSKDLDMNRFLRQSTNSHETVDMSRFLQKLKHCNGEDSTKLHNNLIQPRLKIQGFGINLDSKQVVVVLIFFFTWKIGNWASAPIYYKDLRSSAQAPTRAKLRAAAPPPPLRGGTTTAGTPRHPQLAFLGAHTTTSSR